jgi:hypothetical protein
MINDIIRLEDVPNSILQFIQAHPKQIRFSLKVVETIQLITIFLISFERAQSALPQPMLYKNSPITFFEEKLALVTETDLLQPMLSQWRSIDPQDQIITTQIASTLIRVILNASNIRNHIVARVRAEMIKLQEDGFIDSN